jgi:hypothetical protein
MSIDPDLANVSVTVKRPVRAGPGGDVSSTSTLHTGLAGDMQDRERLVKRADGREVQIAGTLRTNLTDAEGVAVDIQEGDFVTWANWRGATVTEREVLTVQGWAHGLDTDHVEVGVGR